LTPAAIPSTRWVLPDHNAEIVEDFAHSLSLSLPVARVLWTRGYQEPEQAARFLHPQLEHLHDPFLMKDMSRAVERLHTAILKKEKILLYGDYDVDGTSSVVILKKAIDLAGGSVDFFVPHRVRDGYGMRPEAIDRAAADGITLVVSVDTGIRAGAVVEHASALGIDVIVTDHHLPEADLPPAFAVLNPNRADCAYPEKFLCGAGVAFKLVQALLQRLDWPEPRVRKLTESFLKLAALATVADVVPLTGENRVIVKLGLEGFHTVRNAGLRALLKVAGFNEGDRPSAGQVAFRIAPRINAAGRMANASDVIRMFLTDDPAEAEALASQLHDLNKERQETEAAIVRFIHDECGRIPVEPSDAALIFSGAGWHKGVVGIVASRIVERYQRPVFVLSEDGESGLAQGSGRSISAFHLLEALESMPELFEKFGGHRQAAGVTLQVANLPEFRRRLLEYAGQRLCADDFRPCLQFDGTLAFTELNEASAMQVLGLAPFGFGNSTPTFAVLGAEIAAHPKVREKLVILPVRQGGRTMFFKSWNLAERLHLLEPGARVDLAITLDEDPYSAKFGGQPWCAMIRDIRPAS
jgi:single-stranded-DNA-specific exonuclease